MNFQVKSLIALFVTSSALFLTPMRSDAQVNMKTLAEVAKSCQKDVFSKKYYQQIGINVKNVNNIYLERCIQPRYHYSLLLSRSSWLNSTEEVITGYPGSVIVGNLASVYANDDPYRDKKRFLDCLISQDVSSNVCEYTRRNIALGNKYSNETQYGDLYLSYHSGYLAYVCPSCFVAHDEVSGSQNLILNAFIEWFLKLDKPQRREIMSLLGDDDKARQLRWLLKKESEAAVEKYKEARKRVEQQEQERRRQELLGN